jgi:non-ribosomal peptide synthetase component F
MLLLGGLNLLLNKYTGSSDIIIGMPIYKQQTQGDFVNTVLALRSQIHDNMNFKGLLYQLKQTISGAVTHQNYPLRALLYDLNMTGTEEEFPLFDVAVILENIQEKKYIRQIHTNMTFLFLRRDRDLKIIVEYNEALYNKETIERITGHFTRSCSKQWQM